MTRRRATSGTSRPRALSPPAWPARLDIFVLGRFRVLVDGVAVDERAWRLRKARAVIQLLCLSSNAGLHRDQLADRLWPDLPPGAANANLYQAIHAARRALAEGARALRGGPSGRPLAGDGPLRFESGVLRLQPAEVLWIDVVEFERRAELARRHGSAEDYRGALELYRGDLLADDLYADWAAQRRETLSRQRLSLLLGQGLLHEARGEWVDALASFQTAVDVDVACEPAHAGIMRVFARTGRLPEAKRQFTTMTQALRRELDAEPSQALRRLYEHIEEGQFDEGAAGVPASPLRNWRPNLPAPLTELIGREKHTRMVSDALGRHRLVTLTGPGGVGKTRLAIAVARALAATLRDGVQFVDLSALTDQRFLIETIAAATSVHAAGTRTAGQAPVAADLARALEDRQMLMVLDCCEHLREACAAVAATLLQGCPGLRILATTRERLGLRGEAVWPVPPLGLPRPGSECAPSRLARAAAVRLFCSRAALVAPEWNLTGEAGRAVVEICARLDGLPLAIELAASWLPVLSVGQLAERLDGLDELGAESTKGGNARHRSLGACMAWSFALLTPLEQTALRRMSVFSGSFSLPAVEHVVAGDPIPEGRVLALLNGLVHKSLVEVESGPREGGRGDADSRRYRLLETVRRYAVAQAEAAGDLVPAQERHARYFEGLVRGADVGLLGSVQMEVLDSLEANLDNLRAALLWWVRSGCGDHALDMATELGRFWAWRGVIAEGASWIEAALPLPGVTPRLRTFGCFWLGRLAYLRGDCRAARSHLGDALASAHEAGVEAMVPNIRLQLAHVAFQEGEFREAEAGYDEAIATWRQLDRQWHLGATLRSYATVRLAQGDHATAGPRFREALDILSTLGDRAESARCWLGLARTALGKGEHGAALQHALESLRLFKRARTAPGVAQALITLGLIIGTGGRPQPARRLFAAALPVLQEGGLPGEVAECLEASALVEVADGRAERALLLVACAARVRRSTGSRLTPDKQARLEAVWRAGQALSQQQRELNWAKGQSLSPAQGIAVALGGRGR